MAIEQYRVHSLAELESKLCEPTKTPKIIVYHERQSKPIETDKHVVFGLDQDKVIGINTHLQPIQALLPHLPQLLAGAHKEFVDVRLEERRAAAVRSGFGLFDASRGAFGTAAQRFYTESEAINLVGEQFDVQHSVKSGFGK
jgi:hypothetical protein